MEIWEPKPPGTLWATPGLLRGSFTLSFVSQLPGDFASGPGEECLVSWIVYGVDGTGFEYRSAQESFSSPKVQTKPGTYPVSHSTATRFFSPGLKRPECEIKLNSRLRMGGSIIILPL
jgi:hypothetical protein